MASSRVGANIKILGCLLLEVLSSLLAFKICSKAAIRNAAVLPVPVCA
jgi:hypothetical protein|tara:strand:- start:3727 stop:3870 length:144 start_codon:yes stop_codon:yes gene_type:complete